MQLTARQINDVWAAINHLSKMTPAEHPPALSARCKYAIAKCRRTLLPHVQAWEETRQELVSRASNGTEEDGSPIIDSASRAELDAELRSLLAETSDVPLHRVPVDELLAHPHCTAELISLLPWLGDEPCPDDQPQSTED